MGIILVMVAALFSALSTASAQTRPLRLVAFGDSLTAGYNLPASAAFPVQLEQVLKARGHSVSIDNAGVSGDTAQSGLDRLDWSVAEGTDGVILELGANDALRGIDPAETTRALDAIITRLKERRIAVLLAGMRAPPNMGADYAGRFDGLFGKLAARHGLVIYPFFLDGVAGQPQLNQRDGIHPTADGVKVIVERILPTVETFIASLPPRS
jgi:acyl-CoA thioesterase I